MKKIFLLIGLLFAISTVFGQTLYTRKSTIPITQDSVSLSAGQFRGKLQWQRSIDGNTWNDIKGKTTQTVKVAQTDEGFYRAKITEATCNPVYSDTAVIVAKKAVNTNVTDPNKIVGATLVDRDDDVFTYVTSGTSTQTVSIPVNTVIVDGEKESDIRVVTGFTQKGDTLKVNTRVGTMEDLFSNLELKLSTATMTPVTKSAFLTTTALAKAMKDGSGVIHPVEIIDNNASANKLKSTQAFEESLPGIYLRKNFSGDTIWHEGGASIVFDQAHYQLGAELNYEFKFEQQDFDWKNLKFPKGKLTKFKICTDKDASGIEAKMIVKATTTHDFKKDTTTSVIREDVLNKTFKYLVFVAPSPVPIPFWATVKVDLMRRSYLDVTGEASVSGGATGNFNLELGASYENGKWTTIKPAITPKFTLEGPDVDAKVNLQVKVEVYPHVEVAFYSTLAPYLDIAPYLKEEMEYSLKGNFKYDLYSGVDARVGLKAEVLGTDLLDFKSDDLKLAEKKLYTTPKKLEIVSGNNQTTTPGKTLPTPIVIKVLDSKNNPVKNALVNFKSVFGKLIKSVSGKKSALLTGSDSNELAVTADSTGQASVNWTIADTTAIQKLETYLKDGTDTKIDSSSITVSAFCGCDITRFGNFTDSRDGHVYRTIKIGSQTWMAENLAYLPRITPIDSLSKTKPCYYIYNYAVYGVLYNMTAALSACPQGWHLPSETEWDALENYLIGGGFGFDGDGNDIAKSLASSLGWNGSSVAATPGNDTGTNNSSCFSALPGGSFAVGHLLGSGHYGYWWSSTSYYNGSCLGYRYLYYVSSNIGRHCYNDSGFSIRCIKN